MSDKPYRRTGFTLFETLLVMTLIALVAAIGLPRLDVFKYRADGGAVQIRSLLMQAQRDAIVRQHDLVVIIDTVRHRLILGYDQNNDGAVATAERIRTQALPENNVFARPPQPMTTPGMNDYGSLRAEKLRTMAGLPSVTFRRDGSVSSALELYTTAATRRPKDFRAITVVQATGRTEFLRYTGAEWREP